MAEAVADFFWMRLAEWGVKMIFGYPGDGVDLTGWGWTSLIERISSDLKS